MRTNSAFSRVDSSQEAPRRVVALGGGTGLPAVLRGLPAVEKGIAARYRAEGVSPLFWSEQNRDILVVRKCLLAKGPKLRHDPFGTAEGLIAAWASLNAKTSPVEKA